MPCRHSIQAFDLPTPEAIPRATTALPAIMHTNKQQKVTSTARPKVVGNIMASIKAEMNRKSSVEMSCTNGLAPVAISPCVGTPP
jgi:hypothetical protein